MKTRERAARGLAILGSLILFAAAALHDFTGYPMLSRALGTANLKPFLQGSFKAFWLLVSWHWIGFGVIAVTVSFRGMKLRKFVVLLCGLLILGDAIGTLLAVGFFFGNGMLSLAGLAILSAGLLFERGGNAQG